MEDSLTGLHKKLTLEYIPVIVFMVCLGIFGIIGNAVTIAFYGFHTKKKSSTIVFVTILASLDLFTNLLISTTVVGLFINVTFRNRSACKLILFVIECFVLSSVLVLWIISIDRYLKVCRPLGKQFSVQSAKTAAVVIFVVSVVLSCRLIITTDVVVREMSFNNTQVKAYVCANTESDDLRVMITSFHVVDFIGISFVVGTFIFTYGSIQKNAEEAKHSGEKLQS